MWWRGRRLTSPSHDPAVHRLHWCCESASSAEESSEEEEDLHSAKNVCICGERTSERLEGVWKITLGCGPQLQSQSPWCGQRRPQEPWRKPRLEPSRSAGPRNDTRCKAGVVPRRAVGQGMAESPTLVGVRDRPQVATAHCLSFSFTVPPAGHTSSQAGRSCWARTRAAEAFPRTSSARLLAGPHDHRCTRPSTSRIRSAST